jgi:hypothetical protein
MGATYVWIGGHRRSNGSWADDMRRAIPDAVQESLLVRSGRRCALCFGLNGQLDEVAGQIAHIDGDHSNSNLDNLAFLCLRHHDEYDSKTSQSKGFTVRELRTYVQRLYDAIDAKVHHAASAGQPVPVVISNNQQGGITAATVNVTAVPEPSLAIQQEFMNHPENAEFHSRAELVLDAPYPVGNLYIEVRARSIKRIELASKRAGVVLTGHSGIRDGWAFTNVPNAHGKFQLDIFTTEPEQEPEVVWNAD